MTQAPVYIVDICRTPVGKAPRGLLRHTRPDDLLVHVIKALLVRQPQLDPAEIDDVVIGCAMPEAEQGMNVARIAALLAGLPESVPAMTINRFCASGLQSIAQAADRIASGQADVILAGGTESMSQVPMGGNKFMANPAFFTNDNEHIGIAYGMGITAENVAQQYQVSREQQEDFALTSHQRAIRAQHLNAFDAEIAPLEIQQQQFDREQQTLAFATTTIASDEGPREDTSLAQMAKLKPVFAAQGSVTAATSSQMSDGAACALLVSEKALQQFGLTPMARFCGYAVAGVAPEMMGIGPVEAIPKVLSQCQLNLQDIDWIELNEAFAAQALAVINTLKLDADKVNPYGGAIALGHPLGATGAIRSATCLHAMQRKKLNYGMVTMCIGTGMGAAGVFARI